MKVSERSKRECEGGAGLFLFYALWGQGHRKGHSKGDRLIIYGTNTYSYTDNGELQNPEANLSRAMHYINGSYTNNINTKKKRCGHLFQGRYKSILDRHRKGDRLVFRRKGHRKGDRLVFRGMKDGEGRQCREYRGD